MFDISGKRWFMGKGKAVQGVTVLDESSIGTTDFQILQVQFGDGSCDLYAYITDEAAAGPLLAQGFEAGSIAAKNGTFQFHKTERFPEGLPLKQATALAAEQSNSAFFLKGQFFFKLFRRLQAGPHPEQEIMAQLNSEGFDKVPQLFGHVSYKSLDGKTYALGILENHVAGSQNAWDLFTGNTDTGLLQGYARELGCTTAQMHQALKGLEGTPTQPEDVPYDKLINLLKTSGREDLVPRVEFLKEKNSNPSIPQGDSPLEPQRIHGDYHLGQVLWNGEHFTVLDFEGEPTRALDYRRRFRSPAADIAGMLRSFGYASAVRQAPDNFEQTMDGAFLEGYSEVSGIEIPLLKETARPFILGKAIYEACYELEYRPDWFWIPEQALKD